MTPEARKELDDLLQIAQNWIDQDVRTADCDGKDGFLLDDFIEFLSHQLTPYARRLLECNHITNKEYDQFFWVLKGKVSEFKKRLRLPENPEGGK